MPSQVGSIKTIKIRDVWPKEDADFTPWLKTNIGELDKELGLGLTNPRDEVGAGDFRIDLVADTNLGEVVIENQFGRSDHRHLGQLVTYLANRDVQRAIWLVEEGRSEHVRAVEMLNERSLGQIWMVKVRTIKIGESAAAPLFTVIVEPSDVEELAEPTVLTASQVRKRDFLAAVYARAREGGIDSPFKNLSPSIHGIQSTPARGQGLLYRIAVNRDESRVVITNRSGKWLGALSALLKSQKEINDAFNEASLPGELEWPEQMTAGRWAIRYKVDISYQGEPSVEKMNELNRAASEMKRVFDPYVKQLDPQLEDDNSDTDQET